MKKIFVLEDSEFRQKRFFNRFFQDCQISIASNTKQVKQLLMQYEFDKCFLDHDLGGLVLVSPSREETGYTVVKFIISNNLQRNAQFIIHSLNPYGAIMMYMALKDSGYRAKCIPFIQLFEGFLR